MSKGARKFVKNNIGQIVNIYPNKAFPNRIMQHMVKYENIPDQYKDYFTNDGIRSFSNDEILNFAYSKDLLEDMPTINSYNL
jgi:hypothetical protein